MDLDSPLATREGGIDVVTDVRMERVGYHFSMGKTGRIDVRHFEDFWESWIQVGKGTEFWNINRPTSFISATGQCPRRGLPSFTEWRMHYVHGREWLHESRFTVSEHDKSYYWRICQKKKLAVVWSFKLVDSIFHETSAFRSRLKK